MAHCDYSNAFRSPFLLVGAMYQGMIQVTERDLFPRWPSRGGDLPTAAGKSQTKEEACLPRSLRSIAFWTGVP